MGCIGEQYFFAFYKFNFPLFYMYAAQRNGMFSRHVPQVYNSSFPLSSFFLRISKFPSSWRIELKPSRGVRTVKKKQWNGKENDEQIGCLLQW